MLNARPENVERESEVVSQAGRLGAVTVATNMAGAEGGREGGGHEAAAMGKRPSLTPSCGVCLSVCVVHAGRPVCGQVVARTSCWAATRHSWPSSGSETHWYGGHQQQTASQGGQSQQGTRHQPTMLVDSLT